MIRNLTTVFFFLFLMISMNACSQSTVKESDVNFNTLSQSFLDLIKAEKNTDDIVNAYANIDLDALEGSLNTYEKKLAFWINTYNAFIMQILKENPSLFDDRSSFYTETPINIGGETFTFDLIEHGIIRNSRWKYGLGYIKKWFPSKLEKKFRLKQKDGRVHFALNCGAISCPPVDIYAPEKINEQLTKVIKAYLPTVTSISDNNLTTSPLFSWFRGDFGGKSGIKEFLKEYEIIDNTKYSLSYGDYDWTLLLNNFVK